MDGFVNYEALAGSIKVEDVTSDEMNARILRGIMNNNPLNTTLYLASQDDRDEYDYCPADAREMGWLGYYVGRSTCLTSLYVDRHRLGGDFSLMETFCRGAIRNKSIHCLELAGIEGGDLLRLLGPFFKNKHNLTEISAEECNFGAEGCRQLSLLLGSCKGSSLTKVYLQGCGMNEEQFADIAVALSMHPKLKHLTLERNSIGRNGCVALATLLQFSAPEVEYLDLDDNGLDDEAIETLVPALVHCKKLKTLDLSNNPAISVRGWRALSGLLEDPRCSLLRLRLIGIRIGDKTLSMLATALAQNLCLAEMLLDYESMNNAITESGWTAICALLCNTSSVNATFLSNHTLRVVNHNHLPAGVETHISGLNAVETLLAINRKKASKKEIAMMKILKHHEDLSMQPFFEWDFKVLPVAVDWFARTHSIDALDETTRRHISAKKLSAIYQFVRGMPLVYVESRLRSQLDEIMSSKTQLGQEQLKLRQERLMLDLKQEEVDRRQREIQEHEQSIMARLRG